MKDLNSITDKIIGAAIEVHKHLGPGLLESTYEQCLCYELSLIGLQFQRQVPMPVVYKDLRLDCGYKADILVEQEIIVELKSVQSFCAIDMLQVLTYLKASDKRIGLLINFNVATLKLGIRRVANKYDGPNFSLRSSPLSQRLSAVKEKVG